MLPLMIVEKGDKEDPGNYRGSYNLAKCCRKVFCKVLNERLVKYLDRGQVLHESQAGFRVKRSCIDNIYSLKKVQGLTIFLKRRRSR